MESRTPRTCCICAMSIVCSWTVVHASDSPATQPSSAPATHPAQKKCFGIWIMDARKYPHGADLARQMGGNLIVNKVVDHSRADHIGLKTGDVIIKIDGRRMESVKDIINAVGKSDIRTIDILRQKKAVTLREKKNNS